MSDLRTLPTQPYSSSGSKPPPRPGPQDKGGKSAAEAPKETERKITCVRDLVNTAIERNLAEGDQNNRKLISNTGNASRLLINHVMYHK